MQEFHTDIGVFTDDKSDLFWQMIEAFGFQTQRGYYERCFERQRLGELIIVLALEDDQAVGYCFLNLQPKYAYFKTCEIPEIQDLNVLQNFRRRGVGQALIGFCESLAKDKGYDQIGIGVGLDQSFGAAQRIYARLGYIPDGHGVTYDRKQVAKGEFRPIDENLSLMMTKDLNNMN